MIFFEGGGGAGAGDWGRGGEGALENFEMLFFLRAGLF